MDEGALMDELLNQFLGRCEAAMQPAEL